MEGDVFNDDGDYVSFLFYSCKADGTYYLKISSNENSEGYYYAAADSFDFGDIDIDFEDFDQLFLTKKSAKKVTPKSFSFFRLRK